MRILLLSSPNPYKTAGIVAYDIYTGLKNIPDNEVKLIVYEQEKYNDKGIIPVDTVLEHQAKRIIKKIKKILKLSFDEKAFIKETNPDYLVQDFDHSKTFFSTKKILNRTGFKPDVIIVLFMTSFLSYKNLFELNKFTGAKIYLFPMDMASFTGACHYAWECSGYLKQCGNCPALFSEKPDDQSNKNLLFKKSFAEKTNMAVFAANSQLAQQIQNSGILSGKAVFSNIFPVPDQSIFFKRDKATAHNFFNINSKQKIYFVGASFLSERRKGISVLIDALKIVFTQLKENETGNILLLVAGINYDQLKYEFPFESKYIGFIKDYNELALAYSASDFYISSSLEDSGPTMVLQSILCETPVISFDIGYSKDFIINGDNGFIVKSKDANALAETILETNFINSENYELIKTRLKNTAGKISKEKMIARIFESIQK